MRLPKHSRNKRPVTGGSCKIRRNRSWISCIRDCPQHFLHLFLGALNRWVRVYDYHDALDRVERLRDWYESDPDVAEVESPDINRCLPETIKRRPLSDRTAIAMIERIKDLGAILESSSGPRSCQRVLRGPEDILSRESKPEFDQQDQPDLGRAEFGNTREPHPRVISRLLGKCAFKSFQLNS